MEQFPIKSDDYGSQGWTGKIMNHETGEQTTNGNSDGEDSPQLDDQARLEKLKVVFYKILDLFDQMKATGSPSESYQESEHEGEEYPQTPGALGQVIQESGFEGEEYHQSAEPPFNQIAYEPVYFPTHMMNTALIPIRSNDYERQGWNGGIVEYETGDGEETTNGNSDGEDSPQPDDQARLEKLKEMFYKIIDLFEQMKATWSPTESSAATANQTYQEPGPGGEEHLQTQPEGAVDQFTQEAEYGGAEHHKSTELPFNQAVYELVQSFLEKGPLHLGYRNQLDANGEMSMETFRALHRPAYGLREDDKFEQLGSS